MSGNFYRRLGVLLASAAAGFGVWKSVPGTEVDRALFNTVAGGFYNPPLFVSGRGSHAAPWQLRALSADSKPEPRQAPLVVSLGDDPAGFFQSSPPAPIDLAVIFRNIHRIGGKKAASAAVLAWESADAIGLAALEKSLSRFDSLVMAAPLSRGAVPSPILPGFRRASLPVVEISGDISELPVVNRCPIPDVILGGENAMAGFSVLESEPAVRFAPLLARWDERVVFSFSLLTVLQRLDLPPAGVKVRLGESIRLSPAGPVVPIDRYGRLAIALKPTAAHAQISAEALIDGGDDLFPKQAPLPIILRDDRSAADGPTRAFSRELAASVAAIASEAGLGEVRNFHRLPKGWELGLIAAAVAGLVWLGRASGFLPILGGMIVAGLAIASQWIGLGLASVWLPGLPILACALSALVVWILLRELFPVPSELVPVVEPEPPPPSEPTVPKPRGSKRPRGKKSPPKS